MRLFKFLWDNGERPLALAALYFVGSIVLVAGISLVVWVLPSGGTPHVVTPLVVTVPFTVPAGTLHPGGTLRYINNTCNTTGEPLEVAFESSWVGENGGVVVVPGGSGIYTNAPGCHYNEAMITLPSEVLPGIWYRAGMVEFVYGGEMYSVPYRTETFKVVP